MLAELNCESSLRYLNTDVKFGKEMLSEWQEECGRRMTGKPKDQAYKSFMAWKEKQDEIALFTYYAYADLNIPKTYNCIFDLDHPENKTVTPFTIIQSVWEGWLPVPYIEHGYKHLLIVKFEEEVPNIVNELYQEEAKYSSVPKASLRLGICDLADFVSIQERINHNRE